MPARSRRSCTWCRCSCSLITLRSRAAPTSTSRGTSRSPSLSSKAVLKTTPLHERTAALCVSHAWRRWAGHVVASSYELTHEREYHVIRSAAALFDVSPLYKYLVRGRDAAKLLDLVVTRNVHKAAIGQVLYTPWCDHAGKVIDDGTVARLEETAFRMTSAEPGLRWLQDNAGRLEVEITDVSDSIAALSLQGPAAGAIVESLGA